MITAMFFGDIIIKEYYSAGEVHVRDINNETEQGAIKYIFFLFSVLGGLFTRQGVCCLKKKKKNGKNLKMYQPVHLFRLGALQTWQTLKVYQCSFWLSEVWVFPVAQKALVYTLGDTLPKPDV